MKRIAIALVVAGMAALPAIAITGAEAAAIIRSEPDDAVYVTPSTYNIAWYYYSDGELRNSTFTVSQENWEADIENALANMKSTVNTLARDSFEALAKIAALQEVDNYLNARINVLTGSVREALSQLTTVKSDDGHGNTTQGDTEVDGTSIKIKGLDVPVDGISIDYSGAPASEEKPNPIGLFGFSVVKNEDSVIPHPKNGRLWWSGVNNLVDENTITANDASGSPFLYQFGLKGWGAPDEAPGKCVRTMNGLLHGDDPDGPHYVLTHCGGALHYTPIGDPLQDGSAVDGTSITTNQATGATAQGKASLYGWDLASTGAGFIPSKGAGTSATLSWKDPAKMVDGTSLGITESETDGSVWEVRGAHNYAGSHARHYFGTSADEGATIGWHELPNITTNIVQGDGVTVESDPVGVQAEEGVKKLGLLGWEYDYSGTDPKLVVNRGGAINYIPLSAITNLAAGAVKVDEASITTNENEGAAIANVPSLYGWSEAAAGSLPSKAFNGRLEWSKLDGNTLSFATPSSEKVVGLKNWNYNYSGNIPVVPANVGGSLTYVGMPRIAPPDDTSVEYASNGNVTNLQIKGWKTQGDCDANLMSMLTRSNDANRGTHSILCRVDGGEAGYSLHYLPIGGGVMMDVDGYSIVTNAQSHANEAALAGFWDDETFDGMFPVKSGDTLTWVPTNSVTAHFKVDGHSVVTNVQGHIGEAAIYGFWDDSAEGQVLTRSADGLLWKTPSVVLADGASIVSNDNVFALYGFDVAEPNAIPIKGEDGKLSWESFSSATNVILAGAGINITHNGNGAITISAQPLEEESSGVSSTVSLSVVTDVRYDSSSHKLQCKRRTIMFTGTLGEEGGWEDVFEAVSHQSEHDSDEGAER